MLRAGRLLCRNLDRRAQWADAAILMRRQVFPRI
jgi:hypothetical protein